VTPIMRVPATVAVRRLASQILNGPPLRRPADVVGWFGAMQGQEYEPAKWAVGLRLRDATADRVERALDEGRILRTHVMRPTWHFVRREDIRWLISLTGVRVQQATAYHTRFLELDQRTLVRGIGVIERALGDRGCLTRNELADHLARARLTMAGQRLAQLVMHAENEAIICSGPRRGRQFTYALLANRAPGGEQLSRDEALARLCSRFVSSHGPATLRDFAWWSGLTVADGRRGVDMIHARSQTIDGLVYWTARRERRVRDSDHLGHLLPIYDEYLFAYRDRVAVPHNTLFRHSLVIDGQVAGSWNPLRPGGSGNTKIIPHRTLSRREARAASQALDRYAAFVRPG